MTQDGKTRFLTGFMMGLVTVTSLILGGFWFFAVVALCILTGLREYVKILNNKGFYPFYRLSFVVVLLLMFASYFGHYHYIPAIIGAGVILAFLAVLFKGRQPYIANVATTVLGFLFTWLPFYLVIIRESGDTVSLFNFHFKSGLYFTLFVFFTILATDTAAYFFGKRFGKTKLAAVISPKKTVEGAAFGTFFALVTGMIIGFLIGLPWYHSLILATLVTLFAQLGDLSESLIKRDAGVKDSGDSLPGHGGILDRADSYLFSAPIAYLYINYFIFSSPAVQFMNLWSSIRNAVGL